MNGASIVGILGGLPVNVVGYWVAEYCRNLLVGYGQNSYIISYRRDLNFVYKRPSISPGTSQAAYTVWRNALSINYGCLTLRFSSDG